MRVAAWIGLMALVGSSSAAGAGEGEPVRRGVLLVTLLDAPRLVDSADTGTKAWPIGSDARWLVSVHVEEIVSGDAPFKAGATVNLLVHSPAKVFRGNAKAKQAYEMSVSWTRGQGTTRIQSATFADPPRPLPGRRARRSCR